MRRYDNTELQGGLLGRGACMTAALHMLVTEDSHFECASERHHFADLLGPLAHGPPRQLGKLRLHMTILVACVPAVPAGCHHVRKANAGQEVFSDRAGRSTECATARCLMMCKSPHHQMNSDGVPRSGSRLPSTQVRQI